MGWALRISLSAAALLLFGGPASRRQALPDDALTSLIEAERAFSRTSEERGIRTAFLEFLAEGAIVFRPAPVEGRPVYEAVASDNPAVLTWKPEVAEISAAGDLGYTSGPYELRRNREEGQPAGFGHYVSVWKKSPDGTWKVILDIGVSHAGPGSRSGDEVVRVLPLSSVSQGGGGPQRPATLQELVEADLEFARKAQLWGYLVALKDEGTEDVRVYRDGGLPVNGRDRAGDVLDLSFGQMTVETLGAGVSSSGDLGYTYGTFSLREISGREAVSSYLKIWRKNPAEVWAVCLDIALPLSPS